MGQDESETDHPAPGSAGSGGIPPPTGAVRVFVLDRHEVARRGLKGVLEGVGMVVVGESGSVRESTSLIGRLQPDVAVLGAMLTDGTGIEVCRGVRSVAPHTQCIILNDAHDEQALVEAVLAGAAGYLPKGLSAAELAEAVRRAAHGESLFDAAAESRMRSRFSSDDVDPLTGTLTPQERRVLDLIAKGLTNRQIAQELQLAEKTTKNYVSSVLTKLGLKHRTQAALHVAQSRPARRGVDAHRF